MELIRQRHPSQGQLVIAISLQSGSNGNCFYVEADGTAILVDAGIPGIQAQCRLAKHGRDLRDVAAVLLSHDHIDHARHTGALHRKFRFPVYCTAATMARMREKMAVGTIADLRVFTAGQRVTIGNLNVETIPTPHDGADGVAFVIRAGEVRLGVLTDLGHLFEGLATTVASLDGVILESNYDPDMLANGPYPPWLQERIRGPRGHLSNEESATLLRAADPTRLQWACLAHLSENNNLPDLARATHRSLLGQGLRLAIASRHEPCGPFALVSP
ncbi:MAG: MBL fold metallo-hydrolase [Candidatus Eisenbacteria bacterium]|nr:MBL fold metallo-hydrolase [Candidatus Eisenbacteria bacterium]